MADVNIGGLSNAGSAARTDQVETDDGTNSRRRTIAQILGLTVAADISDLPEAVQDVMGAALVAGSGISIVYNDAGNTITITADPEYIRDTIAAALQTGTGVTVTNNDGADTITLSITDEDLQDKIAAFLAAGSNVTITYNDGANTLTIAGSAGTSGVPANVSASASTTYQRTGISGPQVITLTITGDCAISPGTVTGAPANSVIEVVYEIVASGGTRTPSFPTWTIDGVDPSRAIASGERLRVPSLIFTDGSGAIASQRLVGTIDPTKETAGTPAANAIVLWYTSAGLLRQSTMADLLNGPGRNIKAKFYLPNPVNGTVIEIRENTDIGTINAIVANVDAGSLTLNAQIADKTGSTNWTPTGAASITGLSAVSVTTTPARTAASAANTMAKTGTTDRILQWVISSVSGAPTVLEIEVEATT